MAEQKTIDVEPKHLKMVKAVFARHLPFKQVWAYGSRVKWTANKTSDLDCAVFAATDREIYKAQEAFNESDIPFEVQLLNWETIPESFKENIQKEYFVLRKESDWGLSKLAKLTTKIGSGATPAGGKGAYLEKGLSLIRSLNVYDFHFTEEDLAFISKKQADKLKNVEVLENDVLLNITGASVARCCIVPKHILPARVNQHVSIIRANGTDLHSSFLHYVLVSPYYKQRLLSISKGGATREALTKESIENFEIYYPPLPVQKKIAGVLSAYDDLIENNNKRIKLLEEMAQKLYKEWFVDFKFPNHETTKFIDSELGKIPEGWSVDSLKNVANLVMGQSPESQFYNETGDGLPFHQGVTNFGERFPTDKTYCTKETRIANNGDILFSVRAPVGRMNLCNKKIIIGRGISGIRSKTDNQTFLFYQLKNQFIKEDSMGSGAIFNAVTKSDMENIKLLKPNNKMVLNYEKIVVPISKEIENLIYRIENLQKTRDLLLPRLISGELSVEDLEVKI